MIDALVVSALLVYLPGRPATQGQQTPPPSAASAEPAPATDAGPPGAGHMMYIDSASLARLKKEVVSSIEQALTGTQRPLAR